MKKILLTFTLGVSLGASAQLLNVGNVAQVPIPEDLTNKVAAISPDGSYLLITTDYNKGLAKYDLATGMMTSVTDVDGAGYDVKISTDGQNIVYRETSFTAEHLKMVALKSKDMATGTTTMLVAPTRDMVVSERTVKASNKVKAALGLQRPTLSIDKLHLMITEGGETREFSPLGTDKRYIWPSVSPDGTKALFYVTGFGAYVCNIDGTDVKELGQVRAPRWYNDNIIVGMNDQDNGVVYTSSSIIAVDLNGTTQVLTGDDVIAMYPLPDAAGNKIAFSTPTGEAYIITINK